MTKTDFTFRLLGMPGCLLAAATLSGCGSIQKYHRDGNEPQAAAKLPAALGFRAAVRSVLGATARAPVAATRTGLAMLYDRTHALVRGNIPLPNLPTLKEAGLPNHAGGAAFETLLDREHLPPRLDGAVNFYVDGEAFFPAFLRTVEEARMGIDVQSYIFDNDDFAVRIADVLKAKSLRVPVRVYFDGLGSMLAAAVPPPRLPDGFAPPKDILHYLRADSKVEIRRTFNPYFVADHTKLHLMDGRTAFVGGMNIGKEYQSDWHDLMARIEGPVVQELAQVFDRGWHAEDWRRNWGLAGWRDPKPSPKPSAEPLVKGTQQPLRVLLTDTVRGRRDILKAALIAFRCASRRIWIETPYFSSDEIGAELERAMERGVDVRVIIPGDNNSRLMAANNLAALKRLVGMGAKVYEYPGMTHLKATVCDDWAMFGSSNYDTLSLRINRELNLATSDRRTVDALAAQVFMPDFRKSKRLTPEMVQGWGGVFAELLGDQL